MERDLAAALGIHSTPGQDRADEGLPQVEEAVEGIIVDTPGHKPTRTDALQLPPSADLPYYDPLGRPPSTLNPNVPACYARKKQGEGRCMQPCMKNIKGEYTRCKQHGGASTGRRMKTGQYSKFAGDRLLERIEDMREDKRFSDMREQVRLGCAALEEYLTNLMDSKREQLTTEELNELLAMLEKTSKIQEREQKLREGMKYTIRIEQVDYLVVYILQAINEVLADMPDRLERLAGKIESFRMIEGA